MVGTVRRRLFRLFRFLALSALLILTFSSTAGAHADVVSSDPDGDTVLTEPLDRVTLTLASSAELIGPGFQVVQPNGSISTPSSITSVDGVTWVVEFDPPVTHDIGLRWSLKSADSHLIYGSLDLMVDAVELVDADTGEQSAASPAEEQQAPPADEPAPGASLSSRSGPDTAAGFDVLGICGRAGFLHPTTWHWTA